MRFILIWLTLAAAGSADLSPVAAIVAGWLVLDLLLVAALNAYRGSLERRGREQGPLIEEQVATIYERSGRLVLRRRRP